MGHDKSFQIKKMLIRREKTRKLRRILIVCEGEKTEPNYFKSFPTELEVCDYIDIRGKGYNTESLIEEAIRLEKNAIRNKERYIETWCVFDKDDFSIEQFENAIRLAEQNKIKCAYSIEAFEIWYMLHFNYYDTGMSRTQYKEKLSELLKKPYLKNDPNIYKLLFSKQNKAIKNAKKLYNRQRQLPMKDRNPVTTVFLLVEKLRGGQL
ncbi:MAG: RloB family protein [Treponema sp.]|nr:RloB family protein [Treponema sp.]